MSGANGRKHYRRPEDEPEPTLFRLEKTTFGSAWVYLHYDLEIGQSCSLEGQGEQQLTRSALLARHGGGHRLQLSGVQARIEPADQPSSRTP